MDKEDVKDGVADAVDTGAQPGLPVPDADDAPTSVDHVRHLGEHVSKLSGLVEELSGIVGKMVSGDHPVDAANGEKSPVSDAWIFKAL